MYVENTKVFDEDATFEGNPAQYLDSGDDGNDNEPEPEENINLLVDNVQWQYAQCVKLLDCSGGTKLVELTLCHLRTE